MELVQYYSLFIKLLRKAVLHALEEIRKVDRRLPVDVQRQWVIKVIKEEGFADMGEFKSCYDLLFVRPPQKLLN